MKKILLTLMTLIGLTSYSQTDTSSYYLDPEIFDNEWRLSLKEKINFITFHKPRYSNNLEFRIYRGEELEYEVSIFNNTGQVIRTYKLKPSDNMDLESLEKGVYFIIVKDKNENKITKIINVI
jgi:hypothetical protein